MTPEFGNAVSALTAMNVNDDDHGVGEAGLREVTSPFAMPQPLEDAHRAVGVSSESAALPVRRWQSMSQRLESRQALRLRPFQGNNAPGSPTAASAHLLEVTTNGQSSNNQNVILSSAAHSPPPSRPGTPNYFAHRPAASSPLSTPALASSSAAFESVESVEDMTGTPPRVMLDGLDLSIPTQEEIQERQLAELRAQLERNQQLQAAQQAQELQHPREKELSEKAEDAEALRASQRGKRKVQWVGLTDETTSHDHERHMDHESRPGHVSVSVASTPASEIGGFDWTGAGSDGMQTPGMMTPDGSRPPSPSGMANIDAGETAGLPMGSNSRGRQFTREAAKLVAVHKAKTRFMGKRSGGHARASSSVETSPTRTLQPVHDEDLPTRQHKMAPGGGVLSSLLKLYEQPASVNSSSATLVNSTRNSSPTEAPATHKAPSELPEPPTFSSTRAQRNPATMFRSAAKALSTYSEDRDRPEAARSKAGVFGALQASTMNLGGIAAPAASAVAPAPKRPGFTLSRYSMPEVPRQRSLNPSAENSPIHSPTPTPPSRDQLNGNSPSLYHRKTGSYLSLTNLAKYPEKAAKQASETFNPNRYHHESATLKAARTSGSVPGTPRPEYADEKSKQLHRRKRDKRRQEEIFITMHVAAILQRQDFILRLARALMMFGAPSHRMEYQLQQTAKVLDIQCQVIYIVNFMIVSFSDPDTHTSEIKFIKQAAGLDLGKLTDIAILHWEVVHDKIGVEDASREISSLMQSKAHYNDWLLVLFGACCSCMIGIASFNASFLDLCAAAPLGALLVAVQCFLAARSDILSSIFEIVIAAIISFVASALASTHYFCYAAVTSASIVLILPGWPTCVAGLELQSRSIVSGSVRLIYAVVYALFLGFGISLGANFWVLVSSQDVNTSNDGTCSSTHYPGAPWYQVTIGPWFYFLAVPGFPFFLALRNQARFNKELLTMVLIAGCGWSANHFSAQYGFPGRSDISSALGAFTVGILGNIYGKFFQSTSFIVSCVPILFQLPSGLGNGGLLNWASTDADSQAVFQSGWSVAQQLITVVIGLVVGLLVSCAVVYPFGKRRGGLMTF